MSELDALADEYFHAAMAASPMMATVLGVPGYDALVPDLGEAGDAAVTSTLTDIASRTEALDTDQFDDEERITRDMLTFECAAALSYVRSRSVDYTAGGLVSPLATVLAYVPKVVLASAAQVDDYVTRCRQLGRYLDQAADRLVTGVRTGRVATQRSVEQGLAQLDSYLGGPVDADILLSVTSSPGAGDTTWRERVTDAVRDEIRPAAGRLRAVIAQTVAPAARPDSRSGLCFLPDGESIYADALRTHTSTDLDAKDIHELGLTLCAQLRDELAELGGAALQTADPDALIERLRDDPALRYDSPREILADTRAALRAAEAAVPEWFGHAPETACTVEEMNALEAPDAVLGYYQPPASDGSRGGRFWVNSSKPSQRTRYEYETLTFHESVPGHHLQFSGAQDLDWLPDFRRYANISAYVEGWGLYSERLADEMGLYSGDLARLGMVSFDAWRSCRLVVDTGIHAFGWTRDEAMAFMLQNTAVTPVNIANEVDRYIALPGQATSYMVGRVELNRLRDRSRDRRGAEFSHRDFHAVVLGSGTVTLSALAAKVDRWLDRDGVAG